MHQFPTPICDVVAAVNSSGKVIFLYFLGNRDRDQLVAELESWGYEAECNAEAAADVERQVSEYFSGTRKVFDLALAPEGTPFQQRVWQELLTIPFGETMSYGELATRVGNPKASRAVGGANGENPISLIIPCHRVIGTDRSLTGYGGGLNVKEALLNHEGAKFTAGSRPRSATKEPLQAELGLAVSHEN
ncbi:MAG: ogt [Acidobacteriales bacterium]|nr:ogt [Terriglobales bacterium]